MEKIDRIFKPYLTKKEMKQFQLYDKIPHKKMLQILKDAKVKNIEVNHNSYGEFLFVHFILKNEHFFSYGLGLHEYRGQIIKDYWVVGYDNPVYKNSPNIPYSEVLEEIQHRQKEIEKLKPYEDDTTAMYNMIADLCDEDAALAELEDFNLI